MSGYLQRLVQAVSQPSPTVHPRTGSLFAPYRATPESPAEWFNQTETVAPHPPRSESLKTGDSGDAPMHAEGSENVESPLLPLVVPAMPRPSEWDQRTDVLRPTSKEPWTGTFDSAPGLRHLSAPQGERAIPSTERQATDERDELLMHPQVIERDSTTREKPRHISKPVSIQREPEARLTSSARAERQPDEIQIHIGRIEVTAVPAPPAQRAPKAPDKGISLDAYLERRNGRPR